MKNLKKFLACVMAVTTLGCVSSMPINANAIIYKEQLSENDRNPYALVDELDVIENGPVIIVIKNSNGDEVRDRVIFDSILEEESEVVGTGTRPDGKTYEIRNTGPYVKKIDDTVDTSKATKEITAYTDYDGIDIYFDFGADGLGWFRYDIINGTYENLESSITKDMLEKTNTTIGESENKPITEITVGDSTFPRGDINLDGKVNTVDLLMLKKYLLGLMEW